MTTKVTLHLDSEVYRVLKVKAALSDQTVSETANALISHGLAGSRGSQAAKVELRFEGKMGFPVLNLDTWPEGYVFDRKEIYQ